MCISLGGLCSDGAGFWEVSGSGCWEVSGSAVWDGSVRRIDGSDDSLTEGSGSCGFDCGDRVSGCDGRSHPTRCATTPKETAPSRGKPSHCPRHSPSMISKSRSPTGRRRNGGYESQLRRNGSFSL